MSSALISAAHPASIRTFVSAPGNDSNTAVNCPRAKPCRTLAAAYTVTENGGEIIALDAADYGPITITKQLSIFGAHDAIIAVATGSAGVTINAPAGDRVIIISGILSSAAPGRRTPRVFS